MAGDRDTAPEKVLNGDDIPPDHTIEAPFDPHEAPTKPGVAPPSLEDEIADIRADLRALAKASACLFGHVEYARGAFKHTAEMGEARHVLDRLTKKYGGIE